MSIFEQVIETLLSDISTRIEQGELPDEPAAIERHLHAHWRPRFAEIEQGIAPQTYADVVAAVHARRASDGG